MQFKAPGLEDINKTLKGLQTNLGKTVKGTVSAESPYSARKQLRSRGIHPTVIKEDSSQSRGKTSLVSMLAKSRKSQIVEFTKQMSILLNSEIKLTELSFFP